MHRWIFLTALLMACNGQSGDDGACDCGAIWQPVCADGQTYGNECTARCAGVTDFTEGECAEE